MKMFLKFIVTQLKKFKELSKDEVFDVSADRNGDDGDALNDIEVVVDNGDIDFQNPDEEKEENILFLLGLKEKEARHESENNLILDIHVKPDTDIIQ